VRIECIQCETVEIEYGYSTDTVRLQYGYKVVGLGLEPGTVSTWVLILHTRLHKV
jgi:hypothetical protein